MKKYLIGALVVFISLVGIVSSEAIVKQVGLSSECDSSNPGCVRHISRVAIICTVSCPQLFSVEQTNTSLMIGIDSNGTVCRYSITEGLTWPTCVVAPNGTGPIVGVGVTEDGTFLAARDEGTTCLISRSIDRSVSWVTVSNVSDDCSNAGSTSRKNAMRCVGISCVVVGSSNGTRLTARHSNDDGVTWTVAYSDAGEPNVPTGLAYYDGSFGIFTGSVGNIAAVSSNGGEDWSGATGSVVTGCFGAEYNLILGIYQVLCDGTSLTMINVVSGGAVALTRPALWSSTGFQNIITVGDVLYVINTINATIACPAGGIGIWVSIDNGATMLLSDCVNSVSFAGGDVIAIGQDIYFTIGSPGVSARFMKLS